MTGRPNSASSLQQALPPRSFEAGSGGLTLRRGMLEVAGLLTLLSGIWFSSGASFLLQRLFWMDEVHSWLLINDPSPWHALHGLADGVDFNPPAYYVAARLLHWLPGELSELQLRLMSVGLISTALVAGFLLLRRHFSLTAALAAIVLTAASPVLIHQAAEARFYALWMAAITLLALALDGDSPYYRRLRQAACLLLTTLICTTHYFGIISVTLLLSGHWYFGRHRDFHRSRFLMVLFLTGVAAVAFCLPLLSGQSAALTRPTWISAPTVMSSLAFLNVTMRPWLIVSLLAAVVLDQFARRVQSHSQRVSDRPEPLPQAQFKAAAEPAATGGILAMKPVLLTLMPVALVFLSWLLQPAMVARYAIAGLVGLAPIYAALLQRTRPSVQLIVLLLAVVGCINSAQTCVRQWQQTDQRHLELEAWIDQQPQNHVIVMEDRIDWLPLIHRRPDLSDRCFLAVFDDADLAVDSSLRIVQRDAGLKICQWYPSFRARHIQHLPELDRFIVVPYAGGSHDDLRYPLVFDGQKLDGPAFLFSRRVQQQASALVLPDPNDQTF